MCNRACNAINSILFNLVLFSSALFNAVPLCSVGLHSILSVHLNLILTFTQVCLSVQLSSALFSSTQPRAFFSTWHSCFQFNSAQHIAALCTQVHLFAVPLCSIHLNSWIEQFFLSQLTSTCLPPFQLCSLLNASVTSKQPISTRRNLAQPSSLPQLNPA